MIWIQIHDCYLQSFHRFSDYRIQSEIVTTLLYHKRIRDKTMPHPAPKYMWTVVRWMTAVLICKVCGNILANYVDYFPPNFDADFLIGRRPFFRGLYSIAFYIHITTAPLVLIAGLFLLNNNFRNHYIHLHRKLGRLQALLVLLFVTPSGLIMAQHSLGGWSSGLAFGTSSILAALFTLMGWRQAVRRKLVAHRYWMLRSYVVLCSAVTLRLIGGAAILLATDPIASYRFASWASWLIPLAILELFFLLRKFRRKTEPTKITAHSNVSADQVSPALRVPIAPQAPNGDD